MDIMEIIGKLLDAADDAGYGKVGIWHSGTELLFNTEERAEAIADFLEALGVENVSTGYYDPEEDERNNEVDKYTGWYYVNAA